MTCTNNSCTKTSTLSEAADRVTHSSAAHSASALPARPAAAISTPGAHCLGRSPQYDSRLKSRHPESATTFSALATTNTSPELMFVGD
jgi:hypothetical protein